MNKNDNFVHGSYFFGEKISDYGLKHGYVDFGTFTKNLNMVLNNDIMGTLENNGYFFENINLPDFSDEIDELTEEKEFLTDNFDHLYYSYSDKYTGENLQYLLNIAEKLDLLDEWEKCKTDEEKADFSDKLYDVCEEKIEEIEEKINDLQDYEIQDIFQFFIIDENAAKLFKEYTDYPVYYCEEIDFYIVGITHFGTGWDYVLTDIRCNVPYTMEN